MQLVLTGASGFIGSVLCARLVQAGHSLVLLTHGAPANPGTAGKRWIHWTPGTMGEWAEAVAAADGVINLAGEPIAGRRWTDRQQQRLQQSRYDTTRSIVQACARAEQKPKFLINASAVGYYGPHQDELLSEDAPAGNDFLAKLCLAGRPKRALRGDRPACRPVAHRHRPRPRGGALKKMVQPFNYLPAATWFRTTMDAWIHLDDAVNLIPPSYRQYFHAGRLMRPRPIRCAI